ncbi:MAG: lytic murein transglycosylase [Parvularculaceae bacterium]
MTAFARRTLAVSIAAAGALFGAASAQDAASGVTAGDRTSFRGWLDGFKAEARAAGVRDDVMADAFATVDLNARVLELNENQPEFSKAIWEYIDGAVSQTRVDNGRSRQLENAPLLQRIEAEYGGDAEIIVAIWGLESSYGAILGDYDSISALATLAWRGRRTAYGREQLIGALKIIQKGYAPRERLKGSWAGAMGQTQFIPTTYLAYAIDHDGDGVRDIWANLRDVFASTANYLAVSGYKVDAPWGLEVTLPAGFDYALADPAVRKPVAEWRALGLVGADADRLARLDPNARARALVPAGADGPAFLVFDNFEAILKYNRSTAYALAVGLLSDRVAGGRPGPKAAWPREDRALSLDERKALQQALHDRGFDPGPVDGVIGANTKRALRAWQRANGYPADGYASAATLQRLTS